jgi:isochorismate synthase/2-succinyl-5-enolpyruvyl-6-hydroxy-3-cyclohexene-1-carboxylate synthase/2-succinyl-6-hydroxy-2,4-cyclohexadiene-1-carboxylate synthase/O-succinylbenzoate synthase
VHAAELGALPLLHRAHGLSHALDESVGPAAAEILGGGGDDGVELRALRARLRAPSCAALVIKPTLLGGAEVCATLAAEAAAAGVDVVLTSAFESGVAHAHIAALAAVLGGPSVAQVRAEICPRWPPRSSRARSSRPPP